jgi:tripartite ATP-independent transporter DctP family solute receptor
MGPTMSKPIEIRMGGYGPPSTSFSRALKAIGDRLLAAFGNDIKVEYVWNVMDRGHRAEDIIPLVEDGALTLGYQSSAYLSGRIPELGMIDLPFLFPDREAARAAIDGDLGSYLTRRIEQQTNYRVLGYFENGFRHISNRQREVRKPADLAGLSIRVLPSEVHAKTFALLGAKPMPCDLTEALAAIQTGSIDAQENPLANTVTYGVHKLHRFHTLTGHFYGSRPIFLHRPSFDSWPDKLQEAMREAVVAAVHQQRALAIEEERDAHETIEKEGGEIAQLTLGEHAAFAAAVLPLLDEAQERYGREAMRLAAGK